MEFPPRDAISECVTWIQFGLYAEHLTAWLKYFRREQLLVLNSERFFEDPQATLDRVNRFLGLEDRVWPKFPIYNSGRYQLLDPGIRQELLEYYRPHNEKLFKLLGEKYCWDE
jgi:hypothetical protein